MISILDRGFFLVKNKASASGYMIKHPFNMLCYMLKVKIYPNHDNSSNILRNWLKIIKNHDCSEKGFSVHLYKPELGRRVWAKGFGRADKQCHPWKFVLWARD